MNVQSRVEANLVGGGSELELAARVGERRLGHGVVLGLELEGDNVARSSLDRGRVVGQGAVVTDGDDVNDGLGVRGRSRGTRGRAIGSRPGRGAEGDGLGNGHNTIRRRSNGGSGRGRGRSSRCRRRRGRLVGRVLGIGEESVERISFARRINL